MAEWRTIPGFPGYRINDDGDCVSPLGNELSRVGRKKDHFNLKKRDGTPCLMAISKLLETAMKRGRIIPSTEEPEVEEAPAEEVVRKKPKTDSANSDHHASVTTAKNPRTITDAPIVKIYGAKRTASPDAETRLSTLFMETSTMPPKTQDEIKAELLARLNATADVVANLSAQLEDVEEKIAPAPAPFPENVPLSALQFNQRASAQKEKVFASMDGLAKALQEMLREAKSATYGVQGLRNGRAWNYVMEKANMMLSSHYRAVDEAMQAMASSAHLVAVLATFARADVVPDDEPLEGDAE